MNKKRTKVHFNQDINSELVEQFNQLAEKLPGKKFEVVEAAVKCYLSLSREEQLFWLLDPELQKLIKPNSISSKVKKNAR